MKWEKVEEMINREGKTITYKCGDPDVWVESRRRHIPHANGVGTWDHTTYAVLYKGKMVADLQRMSLAKSYAEQISERGGL